LTDELVDQLAALCRELKIDAPKAAMPQPPKLD
jgi:hypothetical protein